MLGSILGPPIQGSNPIYIYIYIYMYVYIYIYRVSIYPSMYSGQAMEGQSWCWGSGFGPE